MTTDGAAKTSLQWLPGGEAILYISGKCLGLVDLNGAARTLTCFNAAEFLDSLAISPDGKQIAITLDRTLYVLPFDLKGLETARNHRDLSLMGGCLKYNSSPVKGVDWSSDLQKLAIKFLSPLSGVQVDAVRILDISACEASPPRILDVFPAERFTMRNYPEPPVIPSYDWDGSTLFLLNTRVRNAVYGYLYEYNHETRRGKPIDPLGTLCCYTDARWSPDGSYVIFAYQNMALGADSHNLIYLIPYGTVGTGATYTPLPLPEGFLAKPTDHPEPAFRPVRRP